MIIRFLTAAVGPRVDYRIGQVAEVPDELATALLRTGQAELVDTETTTHHPLVERAVMPKPHKRKRKHKKTGKRK